MKEIFVFGSNLAGIHGAGAAKTAYKKHGARWGMGVGHYGCSYAIPTLDRNMNQLTCVPLKTFIEAFIYYAAAHPEWDFKVTRIGCGIAGFSDAYVAPFFENAPGNCLFDSAWEEYLPGHSFWGTFE